MFAQVRKNWRERKLKGVNPLLYYGQALASLLFAVYSLTISSWVFAVTNTLGLVAAIIGIYLVHQCRKPAPDAAAEARDDHNALLNESGRNLQSSRIG